LPLNVNSVTNLFELLLLFAEIHDFTDVVEFGGFRAERGFLSLFEVLDSFIVYIRKPFVFYLFLRDNFVSLIFILALR
jgi:hypothetical protein